MAYKQNLILPDTGIRKDIILRKNKNKTWKYGYNSEGDVIVLSHDGVIGDVVTIQGLRIALPKAPTNIPKGKNKWTRQELPDQLKDIESIFEWEAYPKPFRQKWADYIEEEFRRREEGHWFMNDGVPTFITGAHYMYCQWSKIDVGYPEYRWANRVFFIFWEACVADDRCYGMCYLKNRRSGFSFMASSELVNQATITSRSRYGILSKTGSDAKVMFTEKVVPISNNYPFFFKPIQAGMDKPKTELAFRVPASKITKKSLEDPTKARKIKGLDTSIDWRNTGDNSYDGEKLKLLAHDESAKWIRPDNIKNNWRVTKTCLRLGRRIVGKCMMGSTSNALDNGGQNYKDIYEASDVTKRNKNGQTASGLYALFIPMEYNYEGYMDQYGYPVFDTPTDPVMGIDGLPIEIGVIEHWENEADGLRDDPDSLNEFYRQFPRTEEHAFRDEAKNSLFNLQSIYEQVDYNEEMRQSGIVTRGSFQWQDGRQDTRVIFVPSKTGRFEVSWVPPVHMQNKVLHDRGGKYPGNEHVGAFGCDSYDISGTVDGRGSKGSLHGLTKFSMEDAPPNMFFLEYIARPQTAEIFFEDVLMALVFYGMPLLAENNKPRLLYYIKRRGYRRFSMNRPDKTYNKLSVTEREIGGIPNSGEDIKQAHAAAIESYITKHVGRQPDGSFGNMYFNRTLNDWARFDINKRTKFDATISSGLAIMACNRHLYTPKQERESKTFDWSFQKYDNTGSRSKLLKKS